ncbi:MAG: peptidase M28 family protein, partial [Planctomycetota bacterium]
EKAFQKIVQWKTLLEPYGIHDIATGGGGADIGPLKDQGVPLIGLYPDSQRYFDYHHSIKDTFEQVNPRELALGGAALASLIYLIDKYGLE